MNKPKQQTGATKAGSRHSKLIFPKKVADSHDNTCAEIFLCNYGEYHRYIRDEKYWIHWEKDHWHADSNAQELHNSLNDLRVRLDKDCLNTHLQEMHRKLSNQRSLSNIVRFLETRDSLSLHSSVVNAFMHLMPFQNGILNTDTMQYIFDPDTIRPLYMLKRMPVIYDSSASCPNWEAFLQTIFQGNSELIRYVQKAVGLSLSGCNREERFFFAYGSGANGKSVFFEVLNHLFGSFHQEIDSSILIKNKHPDQRLTLESMANLRGIRFATSNEVPERSSYNDMVVKQLCSRDNISAKQIYQSVCSFTPSHKLWIRGNHKPKFNVRDDAMLRRMCLIPFAYTVPKEERKARYEDELLKERKGILNWIIQGWVLYNQEGLDSMPAVMEQALREYTNEIDELQSFIDEEYTADLQQKTPLKEFKNAYNAWCSDNNYRQSNSRELANELRKMGYEVTRGTGNKPYINGLRASRSICR